MSYYVFRFQVEEIFTNVMLALTGSQRRYLRQLAHHLRPLVHIGKNGVTNTLIAAIDEALDRHELIKVKFNEAQDEKRDLAALIAQETDSEAVQVIGNIIVLFRYQTDQSRRKIEMHV
jgi:RNA-binding protein